MAKGIKREIRSSVLAAILGIALLIALAGCSSATESTEEEAQDASASGSTESSSQTSEVGASNIVYLDASEANTMLAAESATVRIGDKSVELSGAYVVDGIDAVITGGTYESSATDQNVFLVINGGSLTLENAALIKTGNAGQNDSTRTSDVSDDYNFYGINSVVLVVGEDSSATISDCSISSSCSGANAVFATDSAQASVANTEIQTSGNSSRGVYATYEGSIEASNLTIATQGAHCAPIATDRGGGYVTVKDSYVTSEGDGSPCVYSTGDITVKNVIGTAIEAQAAVVEGKNSITMIDCDFTTTAGNNGIMLYQSMSKDAADSDATASSSSITIEGTTVNNFTDGAMFYVTNTSAVINLNGSNNLVSSNGTLVNAATGPWGNDGSNGSTVTVNVDGETVADSLIADNISSIQMALQNGATFTGETSGDVTVA